MARLSQPIAKVSRRLRGSSGGGDGRWLHRRSASSPRRGGECQRRTVPGGDQLVILDRLRQRSDRTRPGSSGRLSLAAAWGWSAAAPRPRAEAPAVRRPSTRRSRRATPGQPSEDQVEQPKRHGSRSSNSQIRANPSAQAAGLRRLLQPHRGNLGKALRSDPAISGCSGWSTLSLAAAAAGTTAGPAAPALRPAPARLDHLRPRPLSVPLRVHLISTFLNRHGGRLRPLQGCRRRRVQGSRRSSRR